MQINREELQIIIESEISTAEKKFGKEFKLTLIKLLSLEKMLNPEPTQNNEEKSRLIPLANWNDYHPYPTVGALYQYKHYKDTNGFEEVLEYGGENGGRLLINENKYFEWQKERKNKRKKVS